jgi:hypothetical protein
MSFENNTTARPEEPSSSGGVSKGARWSKPRVPSGERQGTPSLKQMQQLLWKLITAPEGVAQLGPADGARARALVAGDERLSAIERLDIYADMYFYRLRDALAEDFAAVCAVVGEDNFHNLVTDYLIAHPPSHFSLRYAGRHLPSFLVRHPLSQRWPYLGDLAQLEWAILDAFDAPDAPVLDSSTLAAVPPESWPALRFQLTPSLRLLQLDWPADEIWKQVQREEALAAPARAAVSVRVWRQDLCVYHRRIDPAERVALVALQSAASFAGVCEEITSYDVRADRVSALLQTWLDDGLLSGLALRS